MSTEKIKALLLELYPELGRFTRFKELTYKYTLNENFRLTIRYGLPIVTAVTVVSIGIGLGQFANSFIDPATPIFPQPPSITPTPTNSYISPYQDLRDRIADFNTTLPDPILPNFDYEIHLDTLQE